MYYEAILMSFCQSQFPVKNIIFFVLILVATTTAENCPEVITSPSSPRESV